MEPPAVVKSGILADRSTGLSDTVVGFEKHLLVFDAAPEPLDKDVVTPRALAIHADRDLVLVQDLREGSRRKLTNPPVDRGVVNEDASLGHHLFEIPQAEAVPTPTSIRPACTRWSETCTRSTR